MVKTEQATRQLLFAGSQRSLPNKCKPDLTEWVMIVLTASASIKMLVNITNIPKVRISDMA